MAISSSQEHIEADKGKWEGNGESEVNGNYEDPPICILSERVWVVSLLL